MSDITVELTSPTIVAEVTSPVFEVQVGNGIEGTAVYDGLDSKLTGTALSANMGRILNLEISQTEANLTSKISTNTSDISSLKTSVGTNTANIETNTNSIAALAPVDNLTTADATKTLSANQGKVLSDMIVNLKYLPVTTYSPTTDLDFSTILTPGIYCRVKDSTHSATKSYYGVLEVFRANTIYVQRFTVAQGTICNIYMRRATASSAGSWYKVSMTEVVDE